MSLIKDKGQNKAISVVDGCYLVLAGPGAGKTTTITHRIKNLVKVHKIDINKILVMTFTKNAANEMKTRTQDLLDMDLSNLSFGTFHSIAFAILKEETSITDGDVMQEDERYRIISNLCKKYFPDREDKKTFLRNIANDISLAQSKIDINNFEPESCKQTQFIPFFNEYRDEIRKTGRITYDDMLYNLVDLLKNNKDVYDKWSTRWEYIMVDEYQDSNPIQSTILELLGASKNILVVGDDDQSIYKFRGADPTVMLNFPKVFPKTELIYLENNYRSTDNIIEVSKILIENNTNRYAKNPKGVRGKSGDVVIKKESTPYWQNMTICNEIKRLNALNIPYNEMAIIYRTNREAGSFIERLNAESIPFITKETIDNLYEHWIAKDIFAYLYLSQKEDKMLLKQISNRPKRYVDANALKVINPLTIENIMDYYNIQGKSYICDAFEKLSKQLVLVRQALDNNNTYEALNIILDKIGYLNFLRERAEETNTDFNELNAIVEELLNSASNHLDFNEWLEYIEDYTKKLNDKQNGEEDAVQLLTMHGAKGLEFEVVFVPNLVEGCVPYVRAKTADELEEERRMLYVAITRAKTYLYLLSTRVFNGKDAQISRFVKEIQKGLERIELDKAKKLIFASDKKLKTNNANVELVEFEQNKTAQEKISLPNNIKKDTKVVHKDLGIGYVQEQKDNKIHIYFPLFEKILVIDKEFSEKNGLLSIV